MNQSGKHYKPKYIDSLSHSSWSDEAPIQVDIRRGQDSIRAKAKHFMAGVTSTGDSNSSFREELSEAI